MTGNKRFLQAAIAVFWMGGLVLYFSLFVGWDNLLHLLPNEVATVGLVVLGPVLGILLVLFLADVGHKVEDLSQSLHRQERNTTHLVERMTEQNRLTRELTRELLPLANLQVTLPQTIALLPQSMADVLARQAPPDRTTLDPNDINHLGAIMGLFTMALSDLSVVTTRLLVRLLETLEKNLEEIRAYVDTLLEAFTTGDRNVFFRALKQMLHQNPDHLETLKALHATDPEVRRDIAKILEEASEIMALVEKADRRNLIRIVFEEGDLWALYQDLSYHFSAEGNGPS